MVQFVLCFHFLHRNLYYVLVCPITQVPFTWNINLINFKILSFCLKISLKISSILLWIRPLLSFHLPLKLYQVNLLHYYLTHMDIRLEYAILRVTHCYYRPNLHGKEMFPNRFSVPIYYLANCCLKLDFRKLN